jgi:hypothetical protein
VQKNYKYTQILYKCTHLGMHNAKGREKDIE